MDSRLRIQHNLTEQATEPPEVLILDPAAGTEADDLQLRQLVLPATRYGSQIEICRRKGILTIADIMTIEPDDQCRLCPLERNIRIIPFLWHNKILHIGCDRSHACSAALPPVPIPGISLIRVLAVRHILPAANEPVPGSHPRNGSHSPVPQSLPDAGTDSWQNGRTIRSMSGKTRIHPVPSLPHPHKSRDHCVPAAGSPG